MAAAAIALGLLAVLAVICAGWVMLLRGCLLGHEFEREGGTLVKRCRKCGRRASLL